MELYCIMDSMVGFCNRMDNISLDMFMGLVGANYGLVIFGNFRLVMGLLYLVSFDL